MDAGKGTERPARRDRVAATEAFRQIAEDGDIEPEVRIEAAEVLIVLDRGLAVHALHAISGDRGIDPHIRADVAEVLAGLDRRLAGTAGSALAPVRQLMPR